MKQTLVAVLLLSALILASCGAEETPPPAEASAEPVEATLVPSDPAPTEPPPRPSPTLAPTDETFLSPLDMANPASQFCVEQGYQLEMRAEAGGTAGYCIFPDGSECEEWAFYRAECQPGATFESPIGLPNPAAVFCEEQGYTLQIRDEAGGQAGYCLFPDGSECDAWAFFRGECAPGSQESQ